MSEDAPHLTRRIKDKAHQLGFDLVGVAPADVPPDHLAFFDRWINHGYAGTMDYLKKGREKRGDPSKILEGVRSIITCGLNYHRGYPKSVECHEEGRGQCPKGWISCYAWGDDYHDMILKKLEELEKFIKSEAPQARMKSYGDTGPVLERTIAAEAGLGWIGKNSCLINTHVGSYFFLGEILTDLQLVYDKPTADHCGTCTRCLEACPTQALKPYEMDATRCISYLTIEFRGDINPELAQKMGNHLVGCDICQDVCPWNRHPPLSREPSFEPRSENHHPDIKPLLDLTEEDFKKRFSRSAIRRIKWKNFLRNVRIALQNGG